ncbi:hypothetical protein NA66_104415 [Burkholderia pyrrocinia]|uniref:Uncharacterized protein n=1 Tax=Burkholderia pyrrocinia TaxID=60550 RepID=A0A318HXX6_BURPY|nr:hypothetical protein NA66_104415 [Burkholderia pyrrocinia]SFW89919.1 hypothetical protein SAMN03159384_06904 [Burkholderia sp. NFACC33-1]SFY46365.1 hypothetical protein SAMN03159408_06900 [Burkholderia sp. NFPP32]
MPLFMISGDADGLRACELSHAVEHPHTNRNLSGLRADASSPQAGGR